MKLGEINKIKKGKDTKNERWGRQENIKRGKETTRGLKEKTRKLKQNQTKEVEWKNKKIANVTKGNKNKKK